MISLKDLAKKNSVTYEAVRQQVKRYAAELKEHIHVEGRTQYLDDYAVEFLEGKRQSNPIIVYETNKDEEIEHLRNENKALLLRLTEKQEKIEDLQDRLIAISGTPMLLTAAQDELKELKNKNRLQAAELERLRDEVIRKENELQNGRVNDRTELKAQRRRNWISRFFSKNNEN